MKLSPAEIRKRLPEIPGWTLDRAAILKTFSFPSFTQAIIFVDEIADLAEQQNHHPDILVQYDKVTVTLSTHSAGGVTEKDFALARAVNELV